MPIISFSFYLTFTIISTVAKSILITAIFVNQIIMELDEDL